MSRNTSTVLRPAGPPKIQVLKQTEGEPPGAAKRRYVFCWEKTTSGWEATGLFLTDGKGFLRVVEDEVREEFRKKPKKPEYLHPYGAQSSVPRPDRNSFFLPKPKVEYFFAFLPVDLMLRTEYASDDSRLREWAEEQKPLLDKLPQQWVNEPSIYGVKTFITSEILEAGLLVPMNWLEWLFELVLVLHRANWYSTFVAARKQPYLKAAMLLDMIGEMLEGTAMYADKREVGASALESSRDYALYHLNTFSELIRDKYLGTEALKREPLAYMRFAQRVLAIVNREDFQRSFLYYALVDKHSNGNSSFTMNGGNGSSLEFDPVHLMNIDRVDDIIASALATIAFDPTEAIVRNFYETSILPAELKLADTLDSEELDAVKSIFTDDGFSNEFLSGCSTSQKAQFLSELDSALTPLAGDQGLSVLERNIPGIGKKLTAADEQSAIWNWLKGSGKKNIDRVLGTFLAMRESWATEPFGKAPNLPNSMRTSVYRSVIVLRTTAGAYKTYVNKGGTARAAVGKSVKGYLGFAKSRMLDKNRWIKDENGQAFGATPANLNMVFSAIGVVVSIQGIYSFAQKSTKGKKPTLDDYVDLYKSLSSGVSSLIAITPDLIKNSHMVKALGRVFVPLSAACDIHASVKLIKKSQLYFAQGEMEESVFKGIQAGIKLGTVGFQMASLFRWKGVTKFLLRKEALVSGGSKVLGYTFSFAMLGCEAFKWYLKAIEPEGSKLTKDILIPELEKLIDENPKKKLETTRVEVEGAAYNIIKIQCFDSDLKWKDSPSFNGKEIYCDPKREWNWVQLKKLIKEEISGGSTRKGLGWVTEFDEEKAMFELLERGVQVDAVAKVVKKSKEEVERIYRQNINERHTAINDVKERYRNESLKLKELENALK